MNPYIEIEDYENSIIGIKPDYKLNNLEKEKNCNNQKNNEIKSNQQNQGNNQDLSDDYQHNSIKVNEKNIKSSQMDKYIVKSK